MFYEKARHEIKPWKSDEYLEWFRQKFMHRDPHHLLGSMGNLKLTDSLLMPISRATHNSLKGDKAAEYAEENIIFSLNIFQEYVTYLEEKYSSLLEHNRQNSIQMSNLSASNVANYNRWETLSPLTSKWYIKRKKLKKW